MATSLPIMFVGSSGESKALLTVIEKELDGLVRMKRWDRDVFKSSLSNFLDDVVEGIDTSHCALFLLTPDDIRKKKDISEVIPRDDVVFEVGVAIGLLGKDRVFLLKCNNATLPIDLDGLSVYLIQTVDGRLLRDSLLEALGQIRARLIQLDGFWHKSPVFLKENIHDDISKGIETAKVIWAVSPVLNSFIENYEALIRRRLSGEANPLAQLRVVLRDPWGPTAKLIAGHSNRYSKSHEAIKRITASIETFRDLRFSYPDKVDVRILDHPFVSSSYIFDPGTSHGKACVVYNPLGDVIRLPQLSIPSSREFWYNVLVEQAREYFHRSRAYPATYSLWTSEEKDLDFTELASLLRLWRIGYTKMGYKGDERVLKILKEDALLVKAMDNGELIGFSVINGKTGQRRGTVVEHRYRKRGIASDMVRCTLSMIPHQYSEVNARSIQMQAVLEHLGFQKAKTESEVRTRFPNLELQFRYNNEGGGLQYRRATSLGVHPDGKSDWLLLYRFISKEIHQNN